MSGLLTIYPHGEGHTCQLLPCASQPQRLIACSLVETYMLGTIHWSKCGCIGCRLNPSYLALMTVSRSISCVAPPALCRPPGHNIVRACILAVIWRIKYDTIHNRSERALYFGGARIVADGTLRCGEAEKLLERLKGSWLVGVTWWTMYVRLKLTALTNVAS